MSDATADLRQFCEFHVPALERNAARHNVMLGALGSIEPNLRLHTWTLGSPGQCAVMAEGWPILLADLDEAQCHALAQMTAALAYPGVVGPDLTARWFADRATSLGLVLLEPIPQQIHVLTEQPKYPNAPGHARAVAAHDAELFGDWMLQFAREAVPHDPPPSRERLAKVAGEGRHMFWIVDGEPVSMAGIARRLRTCAAISAVYTPPSQRGSGYAGAATAAVAERIFAEGKTSACLYTDLRNPYSNRCYAKIGFKPICASWHIPRQAPGQGVT